MQVNATDLIRAEADGAAGILPGEPIREIAPDTAPEGWRRVAAALGLTGALLDLWQASGPLGSGLRFRLADLVVDYMAAREAVFNGGGGVVALALARLSVHDVLEQVAGDARQLDAPPLDLIAVAASYLREDPFAAAAVDFVAAAALDVDIADSAPVGLEVAGPAVFGAGADAAAADRRQIDMKVATAEPRVTSRYSTVREWSGIKGSPPQFEVPARLREVRETARRYVDEHLIPLEGRIAECDLLPPQLEDKLRAEARSRGLWAPATAAEHGGAGLGELGALIVREQLSRCTIGDIRQERGVGGDPWPALYYATAAQQERWLKPTTEGRYSMFFALTEPSTGSDAASLSTVARKVPGGFSISGRKHYIGRGGSADFGVVFAQVEGAGVTCLVVEHGTPGFRHVRDIPTMGACRPAELEFTDCFVPDENVVGEVGGGFKLAQLSLSRTRIRQAGLSLGAAQRSLELAHRWLGSRVTFGQALGARQPLRWKFARAVAELNNARLLAYRVAYQLDDGQDVRWEVPFAKTRAAEVASRVIDFSMQIHGALGVSRDLPLERLYRDVRSLRITEGAAELQRDLICRRLFPASRTS